MTCSQCGYYLTDEDEKGNITEFHHDRTKPEGFCGKRELFHTVRRNSTACQEAEPDGLQLTYSIRGAGYWNSLPKTAETDVRAYSFDLCLEYGAVVMLIQRENDGNNVIIQRTGRQSVQTVRDIAYLLIVLLDFGIEYLRIESAAGRYIKIFNRYGIQTYPSANKDECEEGREVRYMKLDEDNLLALWRVVNGRNR